MKTLINAAISFGYLDRNPFQGYSTTYKESNRKFLSAEELNTIESKIIVDERLERDRDVFIFICCTGISYSDLLNLSVDNIKKGIDGKNWLNYERLKTRICTSIPLLPQTHSLIDKYGDSPECVANRTLFPLISNQKFNKYLIEVITLCEIHSLTGV